MENLSELIQLASRGSFFVNIPKSDKRQKRIKVRGDYLTEVVPGEWKPHIVKFVEKKNGSSSALSVRFAGDLANQFG